MVCLVKSGAANSWLTNRMVCLVKSGAANSWLTNRMVCLVKSGAANSWLTNRMVCLVKSGAANSWLTNRMVCLVKSGAANSWLTNRMVCLVSCGSYIHIYICFLYMFTSVSLIRYCHMRGKDGNDAHVPHEFDVALCDVTVKNTALSFSLACHSWVKYYESRTVYTTEQ